MSQRNAGDVNIAQRVVQSTAVDTASSAGVVLISVNTTGCEAFSIINSGSVNIYIEGSYNGIFFHPSVGVFKMVDNASVNSISASTACYFNGPFQTVRVVAQSASGVYRAHLSWR